MGTVTSGCSAMMGSETGILVLAVLAIAAVCLFCRRRSASSTEE